MKRSIKLSSKSLNSIETCIKNLTKEYEELYNILYNIFYTIIFNDVKLLKDCAETFIVKFYIDALNSEIDKYSLNDICDEDHIIWDTIKKITRQNLVNKYVSNETFDNIIDIYFNEVKREYILHPQNESENLEFCDENKDIFIKNNLKLVIECAKRYQGLGVPFEDLIQAGNIGLLTAFEKFDTDRANLRFSIINSVKNSNNTSFTFEEASEIVKDNFNYTKLLEQTLSTIPKEGFNSKQEFINWANENIKKATFSSISFAWIRAYIITELNKYSKIIRGIKSEEEDSKISIIRLDSINPYTEDNYNDNELSEVSYDDFVCNDESIENIEKQQFYKGILDNAFNKMNGLTRRVIKKRFGIDYPFSMSMQEISDGEGININQVKYIIKQGLAIIKSTISPEELLQIQQLL